MKRKIYIAGKVSGESIAECTMKFGTAQKQIESIGYEAVNPLEVVGDWNVTWEVEMRRCIKALMDCDAILLLTDYNQSRGARHELNLALMVDIFVFTDCKEIERIWNNSQPTP